MRQNEDRSRPLYMISVVSRMLQVHPQTLRMYEREGLITPQRVNRQRLYSDEDIEHLNIVINLTRELGVNKAGVEIILRMRNRMTAIQREMHEMMQFLEEETKSNFEQRLKEILSL
jgi:MerR family transcriptional regulator/heat shock protein HspR